MPGRADNDPMPDIREIREKLGLNQTQFAELVGVNQTAVSHWEQHKRRPSRAVQLLIDRILSAPKKNSRKVGSR